MVEPKQMLYWNAIEEDIDTEIKEVEPKQMLYWNFHYKYFV